MAVQVAETIRLTTHLLVHPQAMEEARDQALDTVVATLTQDPATMALEAIHLHHALPPDPPDDPRTVTIVHRAGLRTLTVHEDHPLLLVL